MNKLAFEIGYMQKEAIKALLGKGLLRAGKSLAGKMPAGVKRSARDFTTGLRTSAAQAKKQQAIQQQAGKAYQRNSEMSNIQRGKARHAEADLAREQAKMDAWKHDWNDGMRASYFHDRPHATVPDFIEFNKRLGLDMRDIQRSLKGMPNVSAAAARQKAVYDKMTPLSDSATRRAIRYLRKADEAALPTSTSYGLGRAARYAVPGAVSAGGYQLGKELSDPVQRAGDYMANTPYGEAMNDIVRKQKDTARNAFDTARSYLDPRDPGYGGAVEYDLPKVMPTGKAMPLGMFSQYPTESRVPQPQGTIVPPRTWRPSEFADASLAARQEAIAPRTNPFAEQINRPETRVKSVNYGSDPRAAQARRRNAQRRLQTLDRGSFSTNDIPQEPRYIERPNPVEAIGNTALSARIAELMRARSQPSR